MLMRTMLIEKVESFLVSHSLEKAFSFSQKEYQSRAACLVKVTTDEGSYGWGEGYGPAELVEAGVGYLAPLILNKDPLQRENLWQAMYLHTLDHARRGIVLSALSAIDIALWDLSGKVLEQPVSVLLGGRKREKVRPYATGMYSTDVEDLPQYLADEALSYKEQGFEAMKMKVGFGIEDDLENVRAVRDAVGPEIELMVDANHGYSLREAKRLARAMEPLDIGWFEEPVSPEEYKSYRSLRESTSIPIAGGECEYLRSGFMQLFENQSVDIAQPDICAAGGLTEVKKISTMAQAFGVEVVPHSWGTGIALSAALHLVSNWDMIPGRLHDAVPFVEFDRTENRLRDEVVTPKLVIQQGRLEVPDQPGLGVDVDEDRLNAYLDTHKSYDSQ